MLTVHYLPEPRRCTAVCAVNGWSDAGSAASGALNYLLARWDARRFAEYDADALFNYTVTRPVTKRPGGGKRLLHWPDLAWYELRAPNSEHDLVLLVGPEPDLRWREFCRTTADMLGRLSAEMVLTLGAFFGSVPHTGPVRIFGRSTDATLRKRIWSLGFTDTEYEGPTGLVTALIDAASSRDIAAAGLWAAAPMYLQGTPNPKVSAALLQTVEVLIGVDLGVEELSAAGRDFELRVDEAIRTRPDFERIVRGLGVPLENTPPTPTISAEDEARRVAGEPAELPTVDGVLGELESFLKNLRQDEPEGD
ncbi:MAG: PAC2 family protein [Chloroflexi bacterium]|nr:PAC2 family protein [Chloroflexota bacterium]